MASCKVIEVPRRQIEYELIADPSSSNSILAPSQWTYHAGDSSVNSMQYHVSDSVLTAIKQKYHAGDSSEF